MTGPTHAPPSCVLWVNGSRYADGSAGESADTPAALTGLTVTWGRETTLDQPAPASCQFEVLDPVGGPRFTATLFVGARVQVRADATIYPDPTVPTIVDAGFETRAVGTAVSAILTNAAPVLVTTAQKHAGARSVRVDPLDGDRRVRVIFPPADLSAAHDPAAWDAVPRTLPGQAWRFGAAVKVPTAIAAVARATVRPVAFTQPWDGPGVTVLPDTATPGTVDGAGWSVHAGTVTPPAGVWLGVCVEIWPTGPTWDDVPPTLQWDQVPATVTWDDVAASYVDDLVMLAPAAGASRAGEVFTGRITDLVAAWDESLGATVATVTAQDDTAELANRYTAAAPWAVESLTARFGRIVAATWPGLAYTVDPAVANIPVTYRDVDAQPGLTLLQELAQSVGGALWSATSLTTGPYLRLEDVNSRPALQRLVKDPDGVIRIHPVDVTATGVSVDACAILLDPVEWNQNTTDVATRVVVGWKDQTPDPVKPVDASVSLVNTDAELVQGRKRVGIQTQLSQSADATNTGNALLGRLSGYGWRVRGLTYRIELTDELTPAQLSAVMRILDGTTRIGLPILLTNLPDWSPVPDAREAVPLYLEGGRLSNTDGCWSLELTTSSARATGAGTVQWDQLPATWTWDQVDPAITWNDLNGVTL